MQLRRVYKSLHVMRGMHESVISPEAASWYVLWTCLLLARHLWSQSRAEPVLQCPVYALSMSHNSTVLQRGKVWSVFYPKSLFLFVTQKMATLVICSLCAY